VGFLTRRCGDCDHPGKAEYRKRILHKEGGGGIKKAKTPNPLAIVKITKSHRVHDSGGHG